MVASQAFDEIGSKSDPRQNFGKEAEVRHGKSCSSEPNSQYKLRKKISGSYIKAITIRG